MENILDVFAVCFVLSAASDVTALTLSTFNVSSVTRAPASTSWTDDVTDTLLTSLIASSLSDVTHPTLNDSPSSLLPRKLWGVEVGASGVVINFNWEGPPLSFRLFFFPLSFLLSLPPFLPFLFLSISPLFLSPPFP